MSETIKEETAEAVQDEPQGLTLEKFEEATEVVSKVISETKLVYSEYFSNLTGNKEIGRASCRERVSSPV